MFDWKQPINFWGQVLDEQDQPVQGADAEFSWTDLSKAGTSRMGVKSNEKGLFELVNKRGKNLSVVVKKEGFHQVPGEFFRAFEFADPIERFVPDSNKPVVFRLKRMAPAEPLKLMVRFAELKNGTIALDLSQGRIVRADSGGVKSFV